MDTNNNNTEHDRKRARDEPEEKQEAHRQRLVAATSTSAGSATLANYDSALLHVGGQQPQMGGQNANNMLQQLLLQLSQSSGGGGTTFAAAPQAQPQFIPNQSLFLPISSGVGGSIQPNLTTSAPQSVASSNNYNPAQPPANQSLLLSLANGGAAAQPNYASAVAPQVGTSSSIQDLLPLLALGLNLPQQLQGLQQQPQQQQAPVFQQQAQSLQQQAAAANLATNPLLIGLLSQILLGCSGNNGIAQQILAASLVASVAQPAPAPPVAASNPPPMDIGAVLSLLQQGMPPATTSSAPSSAFAQVNPSPAPTAPAAAAVAPNSSSGQQRPNHRVFDERAKLLYVPTDEESVNAYQRFARQQIELFEAKQEDVDAGAQGRNKPIVLGQVGIRCIHCSGLHPRFRARASVYYPSRLAVLYQAAQNIVNVHLPELCESIPEETRQRLLHLDTKRSAVGGGKTYWSDTVKVQGVIDTPHGLRFKDNPLPPNLSS